LSGARRPDNSGHLSRLCLQADVMQHRQVVSVIEVDILESHLPTNMLQSNRPRSVLNVGLDSQHFESAFCTDQRRLHVGESVADALQWLIKMVDVRKNHQKPAYGQVALDCMHASHKKNCGLPQPRDEVLGIREEMLLKAKLEFGFGRYQASLFESL